MIRAGVQTRAADLPEARSEGFRTDIQGLRALAVVVVLLFHAEVPGFSGGFVGVDVFFVISGYLITGLLLRELEATGRVSFGAFVGRRIRRLLPASALVLLTTLVLMRYLSPPIGTVESRGDALAAATYLANVRFAITEVDYNAVGGSSAYLHYWSLAVEEQFYLVWPLLLMAVWVGSRWIGRRPIAGVVGATVVVVGASFLLSLWWTHDIQPYAFFLLPARAWELAAGGLLVVGLRAVGIRKGPAVAGLGWLGLAMVMVAVVGFDDQTPFPGTAALVPVTGTLLLLASGALGPQGTLPRLLSLPPLQTTGNLSYSLYLWHWPLLFFAADAMDGALWWRVVLLLVSGLLAALTFRAIESPLRRSPFLTGRVARSLLLGLGITAFSVVSVLVLTRSPVLHSGEAAAPLEPGTLAQAVDAPTRWVPSNLRPSLLDARGDRVDPAAFGVEGCALDLLDVHMQECEFARSDATPTLVLFGDSHALQHLPALEAITTQRGWRLALMTKAGCPGVSVPVFSPQLGRSYRECTRWRSAALRYLAAHPPEVVAFGSFSVGYLDRDLPGVEVWAEGLEQTLDLLDPTTVPVILGDTPTPGRPTPPDCLSQNLSAATACAFERDEQRARPLHEAERAAVEGVGGLFIDVYDVLCPGERCPVIVGDVLLYRDDSHLTATASSSLIEVLDAALDPVLTERGDPG